MPIAARWYKKEGSGVGLRLGFNLQGLAVARRLLLVPSSFTVCIESLIHLRVRVLVLYVIITIGVGG